MSREAADKPVEIWFTDQARVGQQGTVTRIWTKRSSRPRAPRDRRYEWAYVFGAVCPDRSTGAAVIMPEVNVAAMNEHLAEISHCVRSMRSPSWCWMAPVAPLATAQRFHRTLAIEAIGRGSFADLAQCQRRFDIWREVYNEERPHEALGLKTPIARYQPSRRGFPKRSGRMTMVLARCCAG